MILHGWFFNIGLIEHIYFWSLFVFLVVLFCLLMMIMASSLQGKRVIYDAVFLFLLFFCAIVALFNFETHFFLSFGWFLHLAVNVVRSLRGALGAAYDLIALVHHVDNACKISALNDRELSIWLPTRLLIFLLRLLEWGQDGIRAKRDSFEPILRALLGEGLIILPLIRAFYI